MKLRIIACLAGATALGMTACSAPSDSFEQAPAAEEELSSRATLKAFRDALIGIESGGGEGDPVPYRALLVDWKAGDPWNADTLSKRIGPHIRELGELREGDPKYGYQGGGRIAEFWHDRTTVDEADLRAQDKSPEDIKKAKQVAAKWAKLKVLCDAKLTDVREIVIGVRSMANTPSSIENGAVAPTLVGKLPNGKVVVMYGIDIWT